MADESYFWCTHMIQFENPTIDFVRTFDKYDSIQKKKYKWPYVFGSEIVDLAIHVVGGYPSELELHGIRSCLEHKISRIRHKRTFFYIYSSYSDIGDDIKMSKKQRLLADSLIFSVIEFNNHLNEHHTGLASIVRSKLIRGFELACVWGANNLLDLEDGEYLALRDNISFQKYIVTQ